MSLANSNATVIFKTIVLATVLFTAGCTSQSEPEAPLATGSTTDVAAREAGTTNMVCRYEKETGSHRKVKICKTSAQIAAEQAAAKKTLQRINSGSNSSSVGS
ncbi:MAG: hypothetical protein ACPHAN_16255 [Pseudomonadales bacterium]